MATSTSQPPPTQTEFRAAMASLSAGVNIVTTDGPHGRAGLTVSAVCSVTDTPPTMLVCVNRASRSHDILRGNGRVCINVLGDGHEDVALAFAGRVPAEERFHERGPEGAWDHSAAGVPVLMGSAASIVGRIIAAAEQGSHTVLFVEADQVILGEDSGGLVYFRRQFHPIGTPPAETPVEPAPDEPHRMTLTCYNDTFGHGWRHVDLFTRDAAGRELDWVHWSVPADGPDAADAVTREVEPALRRTSQWRHGVSAAGMDYWEADAAWARP